MNFITESKKYYGELAYKTFTYSIGNDLKDFEELPESIKNAWISTGWNIFSISRYYADFTIEQMINDLDEDHEDEDPKK